MSEVKKAIIPIAGLGTRFLPLSKAVPKELWPLVDKPVVHYIVEEAKNSGIKEIIFVTGAENKGISAYFKPNQKIEKLLKDRKKEELLAEAKKIEEIFSDLNFSYVSQKKPLGDGHAVLQAVKVLHLGEPTACLFADDVVQSDPPCLVQLLAVFKTSQRPVIALSRLPKERLSRYGVVTTENISSRHCKIKDIIEKPEPGKAPSDMVVVGKYILTPDVFEYLKKAKQNKGGEIILADILKKMLKEGKAVYGYEFVGKWLECGNKLSWLKSHFYLSLKDPRFGRDLANFLKET